MILEEIHATRLQRRRLPCADVHDGHAAAARQRDAEAALPAGIATGEIRFQAFGVTEPTTGSDTTQLKTRAIRDGDHFVVNGQKLWTSRAHKSDLMLLLVRTTPVEEVKRRPRAFRSSWSTCAMRSARG